MQVWLLSLVSLALAVLVSFLLREQTQESSEEQAPQLPPKLAGLLSTPTATLTAEDMGGISLKTLASARVRWLALRTELVKEYPDLVKDEFLCPSSAVLTDAMLLRFLRAESHTKHTDLEGAVLERIKKAALFRRDYRVLDFHRRGMAEALFLHSFNCNAAMYFGDCGVRNRQGEPVIIGRLNLLKGMNVHSANHLRAGLFVIERVAAKLVLPLRKASYILDLSNMDDEDWPRFWDAPPQIGSSPSRAGSVGPHLSGHLEIPPGLPVLKEAMVMVTSHYPELLRKVYFYKPPMWFYVMFKVFSLWVDKVTRGKFVMVNAGDEKVFLDDIGPDQLPKEFGGRGISLDRDIFMRRCINAYDERGSLPYSHELCSPRPCGTPFQPPRGTVASSSSIISPSPLSSPSSLSSLSPPSKSRPSPSHSRFSQTPKSSRLKRIAQKIKGIWT